MLRSSPATLLLPFGRNRTGSLALCFTLVCLDSSNDANPAPPTKPPLAALSSPAAAGSPLQLPSCLVLSAAVAAATAAVGSYKLTRVGDKGPVMMDFSLVVDRRGRNEPSCCSVLLELRLAEAAEGDAFICRESVDVREDRPGSRAWSMSGAAASRKRRPWMAREGLMRRGRARLIRRPMAVAVGALAESASAGDVAVGVEGAGGAPA